jgi:hypothetical protein
VGGFACLVFGPRWTKPNTNRAAAFWLIAVLLAVPIVTQFPPRAFNFDDDFQKYFTHVARMVQTGTANGGGPFSSLGFDTLGGQAFLQSFVGTFLPISYINGIDAVFGLFLCLALAVEFSARNRWVAVAAALSVIAINPQYVNVSALYTGSALMMAIFAIALDDGEEPNPIAMALLFAGLIALKSTFGLFVVLLLPSIGLCAAKVWRWMAAASISTGVFLAPWVIPHLAEFRTRGGTAGAPGPSVALRDLFDTTTLAYGASMATYTILVIVVVLAALAIAWANRAARMAAALGAAVLVAYIVLTLFVAPRSYGLEHSVRYFLPLIIAVVPAVLGIAGSKERWIVVAVLLALIPFGPSFAARIRQAFTSGSVLAFSWLATDSDYLEYNRRVLDRPERGRVAALQQSIPAGERVLAWIGAPFYLNYVRNPILDSESCGLCDAHAALPPFRYVIWEYNGYSTKDAADYEEQALDPDAGTQMRAVSAHWLDLSRQMTRWKESGQTLYDDGSIAVIQVEESPR